MLILELEGHHNSVLALFVTTGAMADRIIISARQARRQSLYIKALCLFEYEPYGQPVDLRDIDRTVVHNALRSEVIRCDLIDVAAPVDGVCHDEHAQLVLLAQFLAPPLEGVR